MMAAPKDVRTLSGSTTGVAAVLTLIVAVSFAALFAPYAGGA